jgi:hypothetical protein
MNQLPNIPISDRIRLIGYGLLAGIVVGAVFGWMFHGVIGFIIRLVIVAILLLPVVLAFMFWRQVTAKQVPPRSNTTRDADWVEIEPTSRPRQYESAGSGRANGP